MRFQVPQFIDIEDKIVGPFTLKQFLIYVAACMTLVPVYIYSDLSLFITIALPILGIAAAFAHVKVYGKSLSQVVFSGIYYLSKGQLYIWRRQKNQPFKIIDPEWNADLSERVNTSLTRPASSLNVIAQSLETTGNISKEDIPDPLMVQ
ncbi:MAG TPA: PrgI family protein [Candidatus Andersenbacteria bacterium]|nr:PrgI family protein [Candidatus Andersenbacteria bacterium]